MGKVIPTLTNTTYITIILPQNCPKTTSKLPQNFWICSDPPTFWRFWGKKKSASKLLVWSRPPPPPPLEKKTHIWAIRFILKASLRLGGTRQRTSASSRTPRRPRWRLQWWTSGGAGGRPGCRPWGGSSWSSTSRIWTFSLSFGLFGNVFLNSLCPPISLWSDLRMRSWSAQLLFDGAAATAAHCLQYLV